MAAAERYAAQHDAGIAFTATTADAKAFYLRLGCERDF